MGDYEIRDIYQGGYSSLKPNYGEIFSGYRTYGGLIGTPSAPPGQQGDVVTNLSKSIATGQKVVELSFLNPEIIDTIPKQHLHEAKRLADLAGVEVTVHGPLVEASGAVEGTYSDDQRIIAERRILEALKRSHELNPKGNISVTFHTTNGAPGPVWKKEPGKKEEIIMLPVVDRETGRIAVAKKEEKYYPIINEKGEIAKEVHTPERTLKIMNDTKWSTELDQIEFNRERADKILEEVHPLDVNKYLHLKMHEMAPNKIPKPQIDPQDYGQVKKIYSADAYLTEAQKKVNALFDDAYKYYKEPEKKEYLKKLAEEYTNSIGNENGNPIAESHAIFEITKKLKEMPNLKLEKEKFGSPQIYVPAEEYTIERSRQSFGNAAFQAYKMFGKNTPIMNIENPPAGFGLSRAKDVENLIKGSRDQFVENAIKSKNDGGLGMSKQYAEKEAEKIIGATWDLGHINQLRKFGFSGEDVIKEAERVAPYIKHIHLSDNFGLENTELPPGMGNVDFKEVMEKLGEKGEKAKKIVEAFHWVQAMKSSPFAVSLEGVGAPIYSMGGMPYWNQSPTFTEGYLGGYGMMLPQINYETFGTGFSNLPTELGGQRPGGGRGRMSGTPME
ncbi:sugar phosphate isomerase/epimerase [Candidatus Pacearchaeota archaeon]|nr:sugar phosphate isomerase/epimerase [Candidatus Pacearchaeota archaeon]